MVATSALANDYETDSADHFIELIAAIPGYTNTTSDHLPVYARFDFLGMHTAVEETAPTASLSLDAAYPNPFVREITISYALDRPGDVALEVFDTLGRRVVALASGFQAAGTHRALLNGSALASGIYTVRLSAGGQVAAIQIARGR